MVLLTRTDLVSARANYEKAQKEALLDMFRQQIKDKLLQEARLGNTGTVLTLLDTPPTPPAPVGQLPCAELSADDKLSAIRTMLQDIPITIEKVENKILVIIQWA